MSAYPKFRDVHLYVGLALLIPVALMSITGILWNHEKTLGLKPSLTKPQKEKGPKHKEAMPEKSSGESPLLTSKPGALASHEGAVNGALAAASEVWGGDMALERIEFRNEPGYGLVVKVKAEKGLRLSPDEIVWSVDAQQIVEKKGDMAGGTDWAKFVHDLHTGAIFNREYGFLWSDISAGAILLLSLTGIVLYSIPVWKKFQKKHAPKAKAVPKATAKMAGRPEPVTVE